MLLSDDEIKGLIDGGVLVGGAKENVGPVTYDLRTRDFVQEPGTKSRSVELLPGDSTYVECEEAVRLPNDLAARVLLRNSRIREGLTLDAPLYFPGHATRLYFRVTNVSAKGISLGTSRGIAQVAFERVSKPVASSYSGTFQDEAEFTGLGDYKDVYADELSAVGAKVDEVKGIEKRMYANVLAIMAILAGVFTLVNVNVSAASKGVGPMITMNLVTVGSFAALVALIATLGADERRRWAVPAVISCACFIAAVAVAVLIS